MKARVTVEGDRALIEDLKALGGLGQRMGKAVVRRIALRAAGRAQGLAPVDEEDGGQLRASIRVSNASASRTRGTISATVIAGGQPLEAHLGKRKSNVYAIVQHEDMTLKHDDGQAKYVEVPALQEFPRLPEELRGELDRFIDARTGDFL